MANVDAHVTQDIESDLAHISRYLQTNSACLVTAESCTGGLIATTITNHPGCSAWFKGGFVTYQTSAKIDMLGIEPTLLQQHPPVSETIALQMVERSIHLTQAEFGLSVTGIAGPEQDDTQVPVGTLWVGWGDRRQGAYWARRFFLDAARDAFRLQTCALALAGLRNYLEQQSG